MFNYHSGDLAELAHQLTLAPRRLRLQQLDGIESLLGMVDPDTAYPYDLVCYTITGYHSRTPNQRASVPGQGQVDNRRAFRTLPNSRRTG